MNQNKKSYTCHLMEIYFKTSISGIDKMIIDNENTNSTDWIQYSLMVKDINSSISFGRFITYCV